MHFDLILNPDLLQKTENATRPVRVVVVVAVAVVVCVPWWGQLLFYGDTFIVIEPGGSSETK